MYGKYYNILGLSPDAGQDDIKSAYRRLVKSYHPDVNPDPQAETALANVISAHHVLSNPKTRKNYDRRLQLYDKWPEMGKTTCAAKSRRRIFNKTRIFLTALFTAAAIASFLGAAWTGFDYTPHNKQWRLSPSKEVLYSLQQQSKNSVMAPTGDSQRTPSTTVLSYTDLSQAVR